ncbi:MAG: alpha/beta fold hydrolase [Nitrolancea sp.]
MAGKVQFATANNARIACEVAGQGDPVVLIHGFTLDMSMWEDQMAALASHFTVIRYDARGFGQSSTPIEQYTHHDDLNALLDVLGIPTAHIVGLSMGGGTALRFTCVYPHRVRSLIVADSTLPGHSMSEETGARLGAVYTSARESGIDAARQTWIAHPLFDATNENPEVAQRLAAMVDRYSGWHWLNEEPAAELDPPVTARLHQISAPTLVILGERDIADFHVFARKMADEIPGAEMAVIPDAGHMVNMEAPEIFNELVVRFLLRQSSPAAELG